MTTRKKVESSPIHVDFLTREDLPVAGRLGLTSAPGRTTLASSRNGRNGLHEDVTCLRVDHGTDILVTLQEKAEMQMCGNAGLFQEAKAQGIDGIWLPIPDGFPPLSMSSACGVLAEILDALGAGKTVVIHCYAGLGRAGTMAACLMVATGATARRAIERVRAARPGAIPDDGQVRFVETFEGVWKAFPPAAPAPRAETGPAVEPGAGGPRVSGPAVS